MSELYYKPNQNTVVPTLTKDGKFSNLWMKYILIFGWFIFIIHIYNSYSLVIDVFAGELIGVGGFSTIKEARKVQPSNIDDIHNQNSFKYIIKQVRNDLGPKDTPYAIKDLQNEANFLSIVAHPNIIQIQ